MSVEHIAHETVMAETTFAKGDTLLIRGGYHPVEGCPGKKEFVPDRRFIFTENCTQKTMGLGRNFEEIKS